jgi:hypothetical protein
MCHEPTSVGLPESIGIGKGTVILDDFSHADAIFVIGQNPGTNSPRMMTELHNASRRGVPIVVLNPLRERALERFDRGVPAEQAGNHAPVSGSGARHDCCRDQHAEPADFGRASAAYCFAGQALGARPTAQCFVGALSCP